MSVISSRIFDHKGRQIFINERGCLAPCGMGDAVDLLVKKGEKIGFLVSKSHIKRFYVTKTNVVGAVVPVWIEFHGESSVSLADYTTGLYLCSPDDVSSNVTLEGGRRKGEGR